MTIKLFEAPLEATESAPQLDASFASRFLFAGLASLVAIIPALAAAFTAFRVSRFYASMTNAESTGSAHVMGNLNIFNTPMVIALGTAALLAFVIALLLAVEPKRLLASVGLPFSIGIPVIASIPAFMLWSVETTTLDLLSGKLTGGSVDEVAQRISLLLMAAMVWGLGAVGLVGVCSLVSLLIPVSKRADALSLRRAFVWAVTGVLLLVFAGAYLVLV